MDIGGVFYNLLAVFFGIGSIALAVLAVYVFFSDPLEYRRNKSRSKNIKSSAMGTISRSHDGFRDSRVHAGLAVNNKNEWVEQGRLSDESIDGIFRI